MKAIRASWAVEIAGEKPSGPKPKKKGPTFDGLMVLYLDGPSVEKRSHERDLRITDWLYAHLFPGSVRDAVAVLDANAVLRCRECRVRVRNKTLI
ncbi:protein of unknown function [Methylocaldum szegediense]|uniref:Transposase n=1 Tax=Methylocaldum szegediense TaxID=73780 RepID=A0ABN8X3F8_9GAMM|nr:protein of unknown function [Methylocaldum szegediense]